MQANPRNADHVFQGVDPLLSVEGSHSFQGFQARGHLEVVVIAQPVCESAHFFVFCLFIVLLHKYTAKKEMYSTIKGKYS